MEGAESLGLVVLGVGGVACAAVQLPSHPDCPSPPAQVFVETLDKCFENVCELDLIFHVDKVGVTLRLDCCCLVPCVPPGHRAGLTPGPGLLAPASWALLALGLSC